MNNYLLVDSLISSQISIDNELIIDIFLSIL